MTKARNKSSAFRYNEDGQLIPAVRELVAIDNISITTSAWTAVSVPAGVNCKSVIVKMRDSTNWLLATTDDASEYMTIDGALEVAVAQGPDTVLFYAKASVNGTLEVAFFD